MIISADKVNESYMNFCAKESLDSQEKTTVEKFFQWYCQKKGFSTFRKIDGFKFEFSKYAFKKEVKSELKVVKVMEEPTHQVIDGVVPDKFIFEGGKIECQNYIDDHNAKGYCQTLFIHTY